MDRRRGAGSCPGRWRHRHGRGGWRRHETPITGEALGGASAAALAHTGGGRVTGTEVGDEEGYYEVEVTLGGGQVDVHLDQAFKVLGGTADQDSDDQDGPNDR